MMTTIWPPAAVVNSPIMVRAAALTVIVGSKLGDNRKLQLFPTEPPAVRAGMSAPTRSLGIVKGSSARLGASWALGTSSALLKQAGARGNNFCALISIYIFNTLIRVSNCFLSPIEIQYHIRRTHTYLTDTWIIKHSTVLLDNFNYALINQILESATSCLYLGCIMTDDGRSKTEITRRIWMTEHILNLVKRKQTSIER